MQEKVINCLMLLRFPLIILVVMIHSRAELASFVDLNTCGWWGAQITIYISHIIAGAAVPCFFAISGYMYFYNVKLFNKEVFFKKCQRRFYSLLIPYICWNFIVFFVYMAGHWLAPSMMKNGVVFFENFYIIDFVNLFWRGNSGSPICYQMWFIRDLICVCAFAPPVIYWLASRIGLALPILAICGYILEDLIGFNCVAISFFSFGAYFSISKLKMGVSPKTGLLLIILYLILTILELSHYPAALPVHHFVVFLGVVVFYVIAYKVAECGFSNFLTNSTFFVFAMHGLVLMIIARLTKILFPLNDNLTLVILYFLNPLLTILICLMAFYVADKIKWINFLNGLRKK